MIPLETVEEWSYREKILKERNRAGVPRTHCAAFKEIASEANVPIHYFEEMYLICEVNSALSISKKRNHKTRHSSMLHKRTRGDWSFKEAMSIFGKFGNRPSSIHVQSKVKGDSGHHPKLLHGFGSDRCGSKSLQSEEGWVGSWHWKTPRHLIGIGRR